MLTLNGRIMITLLLRPCVDECELHIHRHIKQKILQSPVLLYISSTWEKGKKLKQSETEIKMIIKIKKHNLCSSWQIAFMSDTFKQTLIDLYEILVIKNLKEAHQIF